MTIIKPGKNIPAEQEVTYSTCEAILLIVPLDLTENPNGSYSFTCACCKRDNTIKKSELSEPLMFGLKELSQ